MTSNQKDASEIAASSVPKSASLANSLAASLGDGCIRDIPPLLTPDEVREFSRIDSVKFCLVALLECATIAVAVTVSEIWWHPVVYILAVIVIGSRINGLGALIHDAAHRRGFTNGRLNDIFGEIIALPTSASMAGYRNSHFNHHRELNGERDPDWTRNVGLSEFEFPAPRKKMMKFFSLYLSGVKTYSALAGFHKNTATRDIPSVVAKSRLVFFVILLATSIAFGFWQQLLLYWLVPLFTVFLTIRYIRNVAEHYAVEHVNVLNESRSIVAPFWERWLLAPWGLNYHLEHHLFPTVPCFRLAALHRLLMTRKPFSQSAHITRGYFSGLLSDCADCAKP